MWKNTSIPSNDRISREMYPSGMLKCHKRTHVIQVCKCVSRCALPIFFSSPSFVFVCFLFLVSLGWGFNYIIGCHIVTKYRMHFRYVQHSHTHTHILGTIGMHRLWFSSLDLALPLHLSFFVFFIWVRIWHRIHGSVQTVKCCSCSCCCFFARVIFCLVATSGSKSKNTF